MVESGLGGRFWCRAATAGKDARNVTFRERIGKTQHQAMYGEKKDVSDCRAFRCRAYVYEDKQRRANGKHTPRAKEAIYVGFAPNMSAWAFWIPEDKKIRTTNQARFDEHEFPLEQHLSDNYTDILFQQASDVIRVLYNKLHVSNYRKVHHERCGCSESGKSEKHIHPCNTEQVSGRK